MHRRARHHLATLPARRGMRASWLRRRHPEPIAEMPADATDVAAAPDVAAADQADPAAGHGIPSADPAGPPEPQDPAPSPGPVRAAFGHPIF